jgi:putative ABC transport system ATP-binding protein
MNSNPVAIAAQSLHKAYTTGSVVTPVLRDLSITLRCGELCLIVGPSGCGKSTLLAILSGLLKPDQGEVTAFGTDLRRLDAAALDRFRLENTGFVFQGFNLFPALTAVEQVAVPLGYMGVKKATALGRARAALDAVGMTARAGSRPAELSGGEKQRVAIARALAKAPRLVFADEPTSALDAANGQVVVDLLHRAARRQDTCVVCVSHDARLIGHADRVLTMEDGRLLSDRRSGSALENET